MNRAAIQGVKKGSQPPSWKKIWWVTRENSAAQWWRDSVCGSMWARMPGCQATELDGDCSNLTISWKKKKDIWSCVSQILRSLCVKPFNNTVFIYYFILFGRMVCGIIVPQPGIEPQPSVVKAWSSNHCTLGNFEHCIYCRLSISMWEGNGNPLQYSCLENPKGGGAG